MVLGLRSTFSFSLIVSLYVDVSLSLFLYLPLINTRTSACTWPKRNSINFVVLSTLNRFRCASHWTKSRIIVWKQKRICEAKWAITTQITTKSTQTHTHTQITLLATRHHQNAIHITYMILVYPYTIHRTAYRVCDAQTKLRMVCVWIEPTHQIFKCFQENNVNCWKLLNIWCHCFCLWL